MVHQPVAQEVGELLASVAQPFRTDGWIVEQDLDAVDQHIKLAQQLAMRLPVLVELDLAPSDLDMRPVLGKAQYELDGVDQQDQITMVGVDLVVADGHLWTPEDGHDALPLDRMKERSSGCRDPSAGAA